MSFIQQSFAQCPLLPQIRHLSFEGCVNAPTSIGAEVSMLTEGIVYVRVAITYSMITRRISEYRA